MQYDPISLTALKDLNSRELLQSLSNNGDKGQQKDKDIARAFIDASTKMDEPILFHSNNNSSNLFQFYESYCPPVSKEL